MIYLDYNATAPLDRRVLKKMMPYLEEIYSNPSSVYRFAQKAKRAVEDARESVANLISAEPNEIVFTSGGTESDNTAIKGVVYYHEGKGKHIITSKIEHHAVLRSCEFLEKRALDRKFFFSEAFTREMKDNLERNYQLAIKGELSRPGAPISK